MPRRTHPTRRRRWTAQPVERQQPTTDALASRLVSRGLASPRILDPSRFARQETNR